jgi:hypothetical protein
MGESNGRSWVTEYANHPQLLSIDSRNPGYYDSGGYDTPSYNPRGGYGGNPGLADAYLASCRNPSYGAPSSSGSGRGQGTPPPQPCDRGMETIDAGSDANVVRDAAPEASIADAGNTGDAGDAAVEAAAPPDSGLPPPPPRDSGAPAANPPDTSTHSALGICVSSRPRIPDSWRRTATPRFATTTSRRKIPKRRARARAPPPMSVTSR